MYEGVDVVESSAVKLQMVGSGSPGGWWSINEPMRPPPPPALFPPPSWNHTQHHLPDYSWTQLLLGGLAGEDDKNSLSSMNPKYLQNWDQKPLHSPPRSNNSHQHPLSNQSNSRVTTTGGVAAKKARIQPSSAKPTLKVRKEKVGDKITALHQLVSPFGKTDTASVLLEAIGYIKFLQNQIEALSLPYLDMSGSDIMRQQHPLNGKCIKRKGMSDNHLEHCDEEPKEDLKSRGLCLVPISCTLDVGSDNISADYWAPAFGPNFRYINQ